jgi:hypothetical protein
MTDLFTISTMTDADFDALMSRYDTFADFEVFTVTAEVGEPTEEALLAIASRPLEVFAPSTIDRYGRAIDDLNPQYKEEEA